MELHLAARLRRSFPAWDACVTYLERLGLPAARCFALAADAAGNGTGSVRQAMLRLHADVAGTRQVEIDSANPALTSIEGRLAASDSPLPAEAVAAERQVGATPHLNLAPPIERRSMSPLEWPGGFHSRQQRHDEPGEANDAERAGGAGRSRKSGDTAPAPANNWEMSGTVRRLVLLTLILVQAYYATAYMAAVLPYHGQRPLEIAILGLFAILSAWVSAGFWTALLGFWVQITGRDRFAISATAAPDTPLDPAARTAVIMPICNEDVTRVFAGLRATYESLQATGEGAHFDFFVLSDSSDADKRVAEVAAWSELCRAVQGFGRIFYRWRKHRIKRKSGNVADFCRRWGARYRYMVVLDADSVMSGECLTRLTRLMEANPHAGIIQTAPRAAGRDTLYARIQQFATRVYGPLFVAGLHFWQLGESHYWGHNAIIRVAPFLKYCALGRLPGRGPLSGEILSHDFVEAALMRRAGWGVWIAYDLPGSYEEMPPNLVDELKRDRRWCQGNLMNFRLFLAKGLHPAHRAVFMTGVVAYVSAPLWFLFLLLATAQLAVHTLAEPEYFMQPFQLFPVWPEWNPERAMGLFIATATMLFLPKILSVLLIWREGARDFGGAVQVTLSMLGELLFSALLAPIRMLFHTHFVLATLLGRTIQWKSPPRDDAETGWGEALRRHGVHSLLGIAWAALVYWVNPSYLWWLLPVVGALAISMPLSVFSSRVSLGRALRKRRFFLIPEEANPPRELRATDTHTRRASDPPRFVDAVLDPTVNALLCAAGKHRTTRSEALVRRHDELIRTALRDGPESLDASQKMQLLGDAAVLSRLHFEVWVSKSAHTSWRRARSSDPEIEALPLSSCPQHAPT